MLPRLRRLQPVKTERTDAWFRCNESWPITLLREEAGIGFRAR